VVVAYSTNKNCSGATTIVKGSTDSSGGIVITITWPNTGPGSYYVCVTDRSGHHYRSPTQFTVPAPTISVSPNPVISSKQVTVAGQYYFPGGTVEVDYGVGNACASMAGTTTVQPDASFTLTFTAPNVTSDTNYMVIGVEPTGTCGAKPKLSANTGLTVKPQAPASIQISKPVLSLQSATVTGQQFDPNTTVDVRYGPGNSNGCANSIGTATTDAHGNFTLPFNTPFELTDTPIEIQAVEPQGSCGQAPTKHATTSAVIKATLPIAAYCIIGLLLLLLLLLLLFLLFRSRRKDEPVTVEERDRVVVRPDARGNPGGPGATALVDRQIVARGPRGKEVVIAEEVTTVEEAEEEIPDRRGLPPSGRSPFPGSGPPNAGFGFSR
jgi:hypothetical protein